MIIFLMIISDRQIEAISDEFSSTFGRIDQNTLRNTLNKSELSQLKLLLMKKLGEGIKIIFKEIQTINNSSSVYSIEVLDH